MSSLSILNPVYRRDNMAPFYVLDDIFTNEELDKITRYCQQMGTEKASVVQSRGNTVTDDKLRKSDILIHPATLENRWIFDRVVEAFEAANRDAYNFDLEPVIITEIVVTAKAVFEQQPQFAQDGLIGQ